MLGFQVRLPVDLLCYDLLNLFCDRGDGRFVLKEKQFKSKANTIYCQIRIKLIVGTATNKLKCNPEELSNNPYIDLN